MRFFCGPPQIAQARGPPLWDECDSQVAEGIQIKPDWDLTAQPAPDYEVTSASMGDDVKRRF